ncbi:MAG: RnfABCDGE type electron transport complex subunit B [Buchnera aphidicola (Eriosoma harunire)]
MMLLILRSMLLYSLLAFLLGLSLVCIETILKVDNSSLIEHIDNVLPQSQCGQCGYISCYLYAESIVVNNESIVKCTPGGDKVVQILTKSLNIKELSNIAQSSISFLNYREVVWINEEFCVGCHKCYRVCPVDAIIGSSNFTHTVVSRYCTGCNLCVDVCPTNCITLRRIDI